MAKEIANVSGRTCKSSRDIVWKSSPWVIGRFSHGITRDKRKSITLLLNKLSFSERIFFSNFNRQSMISIFLDRPELKGFEQRQQWRHITNDLSTKSSECPGWGSVNVRSEQSAFFFYSFCWHLTTSEKSLRYCTKEGGLLLTRVRCPVFIV